MQISKALMVLLAWITLSTTQINAQSTHYCGTTIEDQKAILQKFIENRDEIFKNTFRGGAVTYIPIKFHLIGNSSAEGQVPISSVYKQFCAINRDYEPYDIQFYLQDGIINSIKYMNDTRIYTDPNSSVSNTLLRNQQLANRNAVNIFVNRVVQKDDAGVLGRFYRDNDYIIIANGEVLSAKSSLSHEIGHFFGLSHTFFGWEATEYDCSKPTPKTVYLGAFPVAVEYADGRNCANSADNLCDTPADYNLGLGYSGPCAFNGCAKDPDDDPVVPQTQNMMGYFLNCISVFTPDQISVIMADYNSNERAYLRSGYTPSLVEITEGPELISPEDRTTSPYFDAVQLEWEAVAGAQGYIVLVDRAPNFSTGLFETITTNTEIEVTGLNPSQRYYWKVVPVSEYYNCGGESDRYQFNTSSVMTSSEDLLPEIDGIEILPNPSQRSQASTLVLTGNQETDLKMTIYSTSGQIIFSESIVKTAGRTMIQLPVDLESGAYLIRLTNAMGASIVRKWMIAE